MGGWVGSRGQREHELFEVLLVHRLLVEALQADAAAGGEYEGYQPSSAAGDGDLTNARPEALGPEAGDGQQRLRRRGHGPVAVEPLGLDVVDLLLGGDGGQTPVGLEAQLLLRHIV